ncbi:hypothetical protein ISN45_Aa05g025160 [Arabidopsis thaliana x Arabidopsis arenosa]|uniref:NYN domain-containing protein n=1 Tax=Arabidopsis thaliana x Arabidopsis arenosa TaxID=1240361 RepID=A0A8T1ZPT0_9BRAS|nr:hypothetical protein ISN45_Aa05g025160 [Arabidopsis thaliana x Arabidopsis arenosa]
MSSSNSKFSEAETGVFWDLDECPIPDDLSPASIYDNIKLALKNMGYTGRVSIFAYSSANQSKEEFESANIQLKAEGAYKNPMFALDIYNWGVDHPNEPSNLMRNLEMHQEGYFVVLQVQFGFGLAYQLEGALSITKAHKLLPLLQLVLLLGKGHH